MSEEIIKILDHIGSKFGVAIDWTDKNVMPYLQELAEKYINYEIAISATIVIALVVIALILGILTGVLYRKDCGAMWFAVFYYGSVFWQEFSLFRQR